MKTKNIGGLTQVLDYSPVEAETMTPQEFVKIFERGETGRIQSVQALPPKLGKKGFGRIFVHWKFPVLKTVARNRQNG